MKLNSVMKIIGLIFFIPFFASAAETTSDRLGLIYPLGKTDREPLFTQKTHYTQDAEGKITATSSIVDSKGEIVMTEIAVFQGSKLISQKVEQLQIGHQYTVTPKSDKSYFEDQETTGSKKLATDEVDATEDFITGPTTEAYLVEHWKELLDGRTVHCRFGVLESKETFGFNFKLKRKETIEGREVMVVSMKPSSFFNNFLFSLMEDGIEIYMDINTKRYVRYKGITPVQKLDEHGKLGRFTAEIIYE